MLENREDDNGVRLEVQIDYDQPHNSYKRLRHPNGQLMTAGVHTIGKYTYVVSEASMKVEPKTPGSQISERFAIRRGLDATCHVFRYSQPLGEHGRAVVPADYAW